MNLTEFLDAYRVLWSQDHKHSRPGWTQIENCPRCHSTNYHLGIKNDYSRAACYKCGGWSIRGVLREITQAPWPEIYKLTGQGIWIPKEVAHEHKGTYTPPTGLRPLTDSPKHCKYLKRRGFDPTYCETVWGMQATGPWSNYPQRLFIPINRHNRPVSWTARAVADQDPKYQTASEEEKCFDEKNWLFGLDFVRHAAIICEGPLDAVNLGRGAVATFGLAVTPAQVSLMASIWRRIICFDNSPDAQARADKLAETLSLFPGETVRVNLDADDPGSAEPSEVNEIRKLAFGG